MDFKFSDININRLLGIISFFLLTLVVFSIIDFHSSFNFSSENEDNNGFRKLYFLVVIIITSITLIITIITLVIAYTQLHGIMQTNKDIQNTNKAEFLLQIENRYGTKEIFEARKIIQSFLIGNDLEAKLKNAQEEVWQIQINNHEDYVYLSNFLAFLEFISYCTRVGYLAKKDVKEMFGGLSDWFYIYEKWINKERDDYRNQKLYEELKNLSDILKKEKIEEREKEEKEKRDNPSL